MSHKILIVDDEPNIQKLLGVRLKNEGYTIQSARNGREAVGAFIESLHKREPYDLILLDIMMPTLDGKEVLKIIRDEENFRGVPKAKGVSIIMLTASKESWMDSFKAGCNDYVLKPYDPTELIKKMKALIG